MISKDRKCILIDFVSMQALRIVIADEELREELRKINSNSRLSEMFLSLARDLDVMEPKSPEEVRKGKEKTRLHLLASI